MIILKIIYGLLMIGAGYFMVKNRRTVKSWTGNFMWAERYIGNGGTYIVIILLGLLLMVLGVLYPLGVVDLSGEIKQNDNINIIK